VQAIVHNQGELTTQNGFYTDLYLEHVPTGSGDYSGSVQFWVNDPIAAGATVTLTTVLTDVASLAGASARAAGSQVEASGMLYAQVDSTGTVSETDNTNNIYSMGTPVCLASPDSYESDDSAETATPMSQGQMQTHNTDAPGDEDWVSFVAEAGEEYRFWTLNLGPAADTYLFLYDVDGTTLLAENDDFGGSLASQIEWTAPVTGTYYLLVKHWNPNIGGCYTNYDVLVTFALTPRMYLPAVFRNH